MNLKQCLNNIVTIRNEALNKVRGLITRREDSKGTGLISSKLL